MQNSPIVESTLGTINNCLKELTSNPYKFPKKAFETLYYLGYMELPRFRNQYISENGNLNETQIILNDLRKIGASDLSVGRIYEGHINALLLIDYYGTQQQKEIYFTEAANGKIFGVWNSERPSEPLTYIDDNKDNESYKFVGAKTFCSGSLNIDRPIVTASFNNKKQMFILNMEDYPNLTDDDSLWSVIGMEATVSHRINFTGCKIKKEQQLGNEGDYDREPVLSLGAIRFAAVQFGCAEAIANIALNHLVRKKRHKNIIQNSRIAEMGILINSGDLWFWGFTKSIEMNDGKNKNYVNMVRTEVIRVCEEILNISEKAIGVQGFIKPHLYEKKYRDLKVYLKQPNPDAAIKCVGEYFSDNGY